jgi:Flp pilus assembly protein TadD
MSEALHDEGLALWRAGRLDAALDRLGRAVDLAPAAAGLRNSFGLVLALLGHAEAASSSFRMALALAPADAAAWSNLGNAERRAGPQARALAIAPDNAGARGNLAVRLQAAGERSAAARLQRQALALDPAFAEAWSNLGAWRQVEADLAFAARAFGRAIASDPGFAEGWWNRGLLRLLEGDWRRGLADYEWRWRRPGMARPLFAMPSWQGRDEDPRGRRILVWSEQGHGDTIQFLRFVPHLARRGAEVVLAVPRRLLGLVAAAAGVREAVAIETLAATTPSAPADLEAPLMSLPLLLGPEAAPVFEKPYLAAPSVAPLAAPPASLARGRDPVVGLVWAGDPVNQGDAWRSLALPRLRPLLEVSGVRFVSLQFGPRAADIARLGFADRLEDLSAVLGDFANTARFVAALDLVVTVDTAMAHLAGAMGREAWVMLARVPDWRWGLAGETTPWYPSLSLFRQRDPGDWDGVVRRLVDALERWRRRFARQGGS